MLAPGQRGILPPSTNTGAAAQGIAIRPIMGANMLVCWDERYNLSYPVVDRAHLLVIDAINRLNDATNRAHRDGEVAGLLPVLRARLGNAFADEEARLQVIDAADREEHGREHAHLLSVLEHLAIDFAAGKDIAGLLLLNLVCHLVSHLRITDQAAFGHTKLFQAA